MAWLLAVVSLTTLPKFGYPMNGKQHVATMLVLPVISMIRLWEEKRVVLMTRSNVVLFHRKLSSSGVAGTIQTDGAISSIPRLMTGCGVQPAMRTNGLAPMGEVSTTSGQKARPMMQTLAPENSIPVQLKCGMCPIGIGLMNRSVPTRPKTLPGTDVPVILVMKVVIMAMMVTVKSSQPVRLRKILPIPQ